MKGDIVQCCQLYTQWIVPLPPGVPVPLFLHRLALRIAAARALMAQEDLSAEAVARRAMEVRLMR